MYIEEGIKSQSYVHAVIPHSDKIYCIKILIIYKEYIKNAGEMSL
jgi:hypothetical protein